MSTKPISTCLTDCFIFMVRLFVFVLFGNPLSMFVLNLFAPRNTAEFAKNQNLFGTRIYRYYERHALKWPFYWARWWMKLEDLSDYAVKQQIQYFFKVATKNKTEAEALKAMSKKQFWPDAHEALFFKYGEKELPMQELRSHTYGQCIVCKTVNLNVREFMMRHVRLSYNALKETIKCSETNEDLRDELKKYLASGKLNDAQFEMLIDAVTISAGKGYLQLFGIFIDYIKRYGISDKYLRRIERKYPKSFYELTVDNALLHQQTEVLSSCQTSDKGEDDWREFCKKTPNILPDVQCKMTLAQYKIFHQTGHTLDAKAVDAFLHRDNTALWRAVFRNEPNHGFWDGQIHVLVVQTKTKWNEVYADMFMTEFYALRKKVKAGKELTEDEEVELLNLPDFEKVAKSYISGHPFREKAQMAMVTLSTSVRAIFEEYIQRYPLTEAAQNKMFDVFYAPLLVEEYTYIYPLEGELDVRMFGLKNASALIENYTHCHRLSPRAKQMAYERGWVDL